MFLDSIMTAEKISSSQVTLTSDRKVYKLYLAAIGANIISLSLGTSIGWLSPFLPLLISSDSPLKHGPVTDVQATWIASLLCIGAFCGTFLFGWSADKFGRRSSLLSTAVPLIGFWTCVAFGTTVEVLYFARILAGLGASGVFLLVPMYITEIAEDRNRGTLGSFFILFLNIGTLISFVMGSYTSYHLTAFILSTLPLAYLVIFFQFPETPMYLIRCNRVRDAECSLKYLRGYTSTPDHLEMLRSEMDGLLQMQTLKDGPDHSTASLAAFSSPSARKALIIGLMLVSLNQLSGCFALINYTSQIFADAGSDLDPNMAAIVVGAIQITGSYGSSIIVDRYQRKHVYIVSSFLATIGLFVMGTHGYLKSQHIDVSAISWIPVASLSFVIFIASIGLLPLTFVILSEILPPNVRSMGGSLCTAFLWTISFLVVKYFPVMVELIGLHGCMWVFSAVCLSAGLFNAIFIPETRGQSIEQIMHAFENDNKS
ncbi:facilitated trehalose transporter Tret1-like isoform X1 [Anopheles bellator]|uniref:facilitated trehalose transporter Tret1-like isoform X1 n=1 Tax=Anopheles bellator TaxID=139047 RepID=UPI0026494684|nr:facilitated trehalose transporter Tret1-like isoform X1 [Anopheles bellator]